MKKLIRFIKNPLQLIISLGFRGYFFWIPDALWLKIVFRIKMGYKLDLNNPKTFNEKLQWLKLHDRNPLYTTLVDKYEVRKYITKVAPWVITAKAKSLLGKQVDCTCFPKFNVGQDPRQGDLRVEE